MTLKIFNSSIQKHEYKITPRVFPENPKARQIHTSPRHVWIPDLEWIKPAERKVKIKSNGVKELAVVVKIPKEENGSQHLWEAILMIESKNDLAGFARIQIQTKRKTN